MCSLGLPLASTLGGCPAPDQPGRIVVIGIDGLEWRIVIPMLEKGLLPNLAALIDRGSYGRLVTYVPAASPVIWTSVVTGKGPDRHGIKGFVRETPGEPPRLYDNGDRTTKALWNIASDHDRRVAVIGWWMTHPVERVHGVMVAQTNTADQIDARARQMVRKGSLVRGAPGQVYPEERFGEVMAVLEATHARLPEFERRVFGEFPHPASRLGQTLWNHCRWAFRADATYLEIARRLASEPPPWDLALVYLGGTDVVGHRFWRYLDPDLYTHPPPPEEVANFRNVIPNYYRYVDWAVGRLVEAHGPDAHYLVLSDHGMQPINTDSTYDPDDPVGDLNSAGHHGGPPAVLIAAGPRIRPSPHRTPTAELTTEDVGELGSVLDVAPTILALMDLPVGSDMEGHVMEEILTEKALADHPIRQIDTHDTPQFFADRGLAPRPRLGDEERLEQLRSLGYLGD